MAPTAPVSSLSTTRPWTLSAARVADGHAGSANFDSGCFHGEAFLLSPSEEDMTSHHVKESPLSPYENTILPPAVIRHHERDLGDTEEIWQEEDEEEKVKRELKTKNKRPPRFVGQKQRSLVTQSRKTRRQRHHNVGGALWRRLRSRREKTRARGATLLKRKRLQQEDVERLQPPETPGYSIIESNVGGEAATYVCLLLNNTQDHNGSQKQQALPVKITFPCVRCCETHTKEKRSSSNSCSLKSTPASLSPFVNTHRHNKTDTEQQHITNITLLQQQKNKREELSLDMNTRDSSTGASKNNIARPLVPLLRSPSMSRCYTSGNKSTPTATSDINTEVSTTATTASAYSPVDSCCGVHGEDEEDECHNHIKEKKALQQSDCSSRGYYDNKTVLETTMTTTNKTPENCEFCFGIGTLTVEISGVGLLPSALRKSQRLWGIYYRLSGAKQTLLWSHDSRTDIGYLHSSSLLLCCRLGVNVFVYDYPGYGCSSSFKRGKKIDTSKTGDTTGGSCSSPISHNNTSISTSNNSNNIRLPFSRRWGVFSRDMNGRNNNNMQSQQQQIESRTDTLAKLPDRRQQQQEPCHRQSPDTSLTYKNIPSPLLEYLLEKEYFNNNDSKEIVQQQLHPSMWLLTTPTTAEGTGYVCNKQEKSPQTTPASDASSFQQSAAATPGGLKTYTGAETSAAVPGPRRRVHSNTGPAAKATDTSYGSALKHENEDKRAATEVEGKEEEEGWSNGAPLTKGSGDTLRDSNCAGADDGPAKCLSANGGETAETAGCVGESGGLKPFALRRGQKTENLWTGKYLERGIVAAYKWLIAEQNTKPCDIYIFGEGLGVAATLVLLKKLSRQQRRVQRKLYKHMRRWYLHAPHTTDASFSSQLSEGFCGGAPAAPVSQKEQQQQQQRPQSSSFEAASTENSVGVKQQITTVDAVQPPNEEGGEKQEEQQQGMDVYAMQSLKEEGEEKQQEQQQGMDGQKECKAVRLRSGRRLPGVSVLRRGGFGKQKASTSSSSSSIRMTVKTNDQRKQTAKYHVHKNTGLRSDDEEVEQQNVSPSSDGSPGVNGDQKTSLKQLFTKAIRRLSLFSGSSDVTKLQSELLGGILLIASPDGGKVAPNQVRGHYTPKSNAISFDKVNKKSEKKAGKEMRSAHEEDLNCNGKSPVLCCSGCKSSADCSCHAHVPSVKGSSDSSRQSRRIFFLPAAYFRHVTPSASRKKSDGHSPQNDGCCCSTERGCCRYAENRSIECSYSVSYPLSMDARSQQCCCCGAAGTAAPLGNDAVVSADAAAAHKSGAMYDGEEQYCHRHYCSVCGDTARDNQSCGFAWQSKRLLQRRLKWVTADAIETRVRRLSAAPLLLLQPVNMLSHADMNEDQQHQKEMYGRNSPIVNISLHQILQQQSKTFSISSENKEKHLNSRELLGWGSNSTVNTCQSAVQTSLLNCMVEFLQHNAEQQRLMKGLTLEFTCDGDCQRQKANNSCAQEDGYTKEEDDKKKNSNGEDNERKRFGNMKGGDLACTTDKAPSNESVKSTARQQSLPKCYSDDSMKATQMETKGTSKPLLPLQNWFRRGLKTGNDAEPQQENHEENSYSYPVKKNQEKSGNSPGRRIEHAKSGGRRYFLRGNKRGTNVENGGEEPETAAEEDDDETKEKAITRPARKKCDSSSELAVGSECEKKSNKKQKNAAKSVEDLSGDVTARPETAVTVKREASSVGGMSQGDGQRLKKLHSRRGLEKRICGELEHQEHQQQLATPVQQQQHEEEDLSSPVSTTAGCRKSRFLPFAMHSNTLQLNSNKGTEAVAKDVGLEAIPPPPGDEGAAGVVSADRDDHYNVWKSDDAELKQNDEQRQFRISKCSDHGERRESEENDSTTPSAHMSTACARGHRRRFQKKPSKKSGSKHNDRRSSISCNDSLGGTEREEEQDNNDDSSDMTKKRLGVTQDMRLTSKKTFSMRPLRGGSREEVGVCK